MTDWYYAERDQQVGPVSEIDLRARLQSGQLDRSALVWHASMEDWTAASQVPRLMEQLVTGPPIPGDVAEYNAAPITYAGFWKRFAAWFIDRIVLVISGMIIGGVFGFTYALLNPEPDMQRLTMISYALGFILNFLYYTVLESSPLQATLGKLALGIIVTDRDGNRISFLRALARYLAAILSWLTFFFGYIMAGVTERKQALHDLIAGCLVVNKPR